MNDQILEHFSKDPILYEMAQTIELPVIEVNNDIYNGLVRSIVFQQLSGKAASTIYQRFLGLFESGYPDTKKVLAYDMETLRSVGLSRQKASYIQNVAAFFKKHHKQSESWENWSDDDLIKHFTQIKGVGKWTTQMILMSSLGRSDIFPVDDLGIQQAINKAYKLDLSGKALKAKMQEIAEPWRPYRSFASRLLWKWLDD
jgi:DNA-3-methyladenine glycosylase II